MKKLIIFCIVLLTIVHPCYSQEFEKQIAQYSVNLVDSDFSKLDSIFKDKKIVILGEYSHTGGTTFEHKCKMLEYLIDKHGFNVIGLEGSDLLTTTLYNRMKNRNDIANAILPTLLQNQECTPLINIINNRSIDYFGIDMYYNKNIFPLLKLIPNTGNIDFELMERYYEKCEGGESKKFNFPFTKEDERRYINELNKLYSIILRKTDKPSINNKNSYDSYLLAQVLKNMKSYYRGSYYRDSYIKNDLSNESINEVNTRDAQMADNVIWYMKHHPDSKIIIWTANFHGARNISQADYPKDLTFYSKLKLMGEYLSEEYGDSLYVVAFTSADGWNGTASENTLEYQIANKGNEFSFIDFRSLKYNDNFVDKKFNTFILGNKEGYWMNIYDGIYFIKNQHKSTPLK